MDAPQPHIACCYDGSAASDAAVAEGRRLSGPGAGRLSVVHVLIGSPVVELDRWIEAEGPDLLITGVHHGTAHRAVLGSVRSHLVHHSPCPVLVMRVPEEGTPR